MVRKTYLVIFTMLVLSLACGDTTLARHGRWRHRHRQCVVECCQPCPKSIHYCLKDIYWDFATGSDLYRCDVHENGCPDLEYYSDLWYGTPHSTSPWPQYCLGEFNNCEYEAKRGDFPGHEELPPDQAHAPFTSVADACEWLIEGHYPKGAPPDLECEYYEIPYPTGPKYAVIIKDSQLGNKRYFGIEIEHFATPAPKRMNVVSPAELNSTGTVLRVQYKDPDNRHALVWMRKSGGNR